MTDPVELHFEEPPPRVRPTPHFPLLLALREHPADPNTNTGYVRIKTDFTDRKEADKLVLSIRSAASKIGSGFEVIARFIPQTNLFGVWARYVGAPGDQPPDPEESAAAEARALMADAQRQGRPDLADAIPTTSAEITGDGTGQALPPIEDDWELPEQRVTTNDGITQVI